MYINTRKVLSVHCLELTYFKSSDILYIRETESTLKKNCLFVCQTNFVTSKLSHHKSRRAETLTMEVKLWNFKLDWVTWWGELVRIHVNNYKHR